MAEAGDGFSILQKRIWELEDFQMLIPGEPGYVDPSTIYLGVDNITWPEAKKMSLVEFITNLHKEQGPITPDSVTVEEEYNLPFNALSYYLRIDAWRNITQNGIVYKENIPIINFNKTLTGFSFTLYSYEPGDVIDYIAFE